jgi:hypothetical protein
VECGCFQGGSTCKLSILAKMTGRRLVVFDSFEGLPDVDEHNKQDLHMRHDRQWFIGWQKGHWAGPIDVVTANLKQWGEFDVCTLVKGWFEHTMTDGNLPPRIALAFVDVDIPSSVRQCIEPIWPRLHRGGAFFSHDVGFIKVLQTLTDPAMWRDRFQEPVPILFGAGYGMGDTARMIGYMLKGTDLSVDYIKNLTIEK